MNDMNNDDDFFDTIFSFAVVVRADINQIQALKKYIAEQHITIAYQKTSTNKLIVKEANSED